MHHHQQKELHQQRLAVRTFRMPQRHLLHRTVAWRLSRASSLRCGGRSGATKYVLATPTRMRLPARLLSCLLHSMARARTTRRAAGVLFVFCFLIEHHGKPPTRKHPATEGAGSQLCASGVASGAPGHMPSCVQAAQLTARTRRVSGTCIPSPCFTIENKQLPPPIPQPDPRNAAFREEAPRLYPGLNRSA